MRTKRKRGHPLILALFGVVMLIAGFIWGAKNIVFALRAERTVGTVSHVRSHFDSCKRNKVRHDCTRFVADITFEDGNHAQAKTEISPGKREGHCTNCSGDYAIGDKIPLVYDPSDPQHAMLDSVASIWFAPLALFGMGSIFLIAGLYEKIRRR